MAFFGNKIVYTIYMRINYRKKHNCEAVANKTGICLSVRVEKRDCAVLSLSGSFIN